MPYPADTPLNVLIAEGSPFIRMVLRHMVEMAGHLVVAESDNGVGAVDLFFEHGPDITLLDYNLPALSGCEAAQAIVAQVPDARLVLCCFDPPSPDEVESAGIREVLMKPFEPERLRDVMLRLTAGPGLSAFSRLNPALKSEEP